MRAKDLSSKFVVMASPNDSIKTVARRMEIYNVGFVVLVDEDKRPVGVVTDRDLVIRALAYGVSYDAPVKSVMTHEVIAVTEDADMMEILKTIQLNGLHRLPVVNDEGQVVGIISSDELLVRTIGQLDKLAPVYAGSLRPSGLL